MLGYKKLIKILMAKVMLMVFGASIYVISVPCFAYIPNDDTVLDLKAVAVVQPVGFDLFSKSTITNYVPTNMTPTTNGVFFMSQMQNGLSQKVTQNVQDYIMKSPMVKDSGVTKTMDTVQKATSTNMAMTSSSGVTHKFSLDMRYADRTAVAKYEGYFTFTTVYNVGNSTMTTTFAKALDKTTSITLVNNSPAGQWNQNATLGLSHTF